MVIPDGFSQRPDYDLGGGDNQEQVLLPENLFLARKLDLSPDAPLSLQERVRTAQTEDADIQHILQALSGDNTVLTASSFPNWAIDNNLVTFKGGIYVPNNADL